MNEWIYNHIELTLIIWSAICLITMIILTIKIVKKPKVEEDYLTVWNDNNLRNKLKKKEEQNQEKTQRGFFPDFWDN